jgi:hypothetical protein
MDGTVMHVGDLNVGSSRIIQLQHVEIKSLGSNGSEIGTAFSKYG